MGKRLQPGRLLAGGIAAACTAVPAENVLAIVVLSNGFNFDGHAERVVRDIFETYYPPTPAQLAARQFTPASDEDATIAARVKEWVKRFPRATSTVPSSRRRCAALTPDIIAQSSVPVGQYGEPRKFEYAGKQSVPARCTYRVQYASIVLRWIFVFAPDGKVAGARFAEWQD